MGFKEKHAIQTDRLAVALVAAGWVRVDSKSSRPCYLGQTGGLADPTWLWTDRAGGARYSRGDATRYTKSIPVPGQSIELLLAGKPSNFFRAARPAGQDAP